MRAAGCAWCGVRLGEHWRVPVPGTLWEACSDLHAAWAAQHPLAKDANEGATRVLVCLACGTEYSERPCPKCFPSPVAPPSPPAAREPETAPDDVEFLRNYADAMRRSAEYRRSQGDTFGPECVDIQAPIFDRIADRLAADRTAEYAALLRRMSLWFHGPSDERIADLINDVDVALVRATLPGGGQ